MEVVGGAERLPPGSRVSWNAAAGCSDYTM